MARTIIAALALALTLTACDPPLLFVEQRCAEAAPVPEQLACFKGCIDNDKGTEEAEDVVYACQNVCERMLCPKETVVYVQGAPYEAIPCGRAKDRLREACRLHGARP